MSPSLLTANLQFGSGAQRPQEAKTKHSSEWL